MSHEQADTEGRDRTGEPPRSRHDEHDTATTTDAATSSPEQRDGDRGIGDEDGALRATRDEVDSVDDAIEAEFVDGPPMQRLRSVMSRWSGELPHPADAERYEQLSPGTLDRLIVLKERQMAVAEQEVRLSEMREGTIREAVDAEADVKRELAVADTGALRRGQWLSWSISLVALGAVMLGLTLGYPQALWGIVVPIVQAGASLVRTVTQAQMGDSKARRSKSDEAE